ncbi:glycine hydroxymethyltransferase shm1 [Marasmius tenuissimus]|nr:glycine hydroxymethyltransferase shm1 [Marasmius tenuissimus]
MLRSLTRPLSRAPIYLSKTTAQKVHPVLLGVRKMATANTPDFNKMLYAPLAEIDPTIQNIIDKETWRQLTGLELIASENLTSRSVMEANGSILTNKYSEGLPGARYYGGNEYIDELESLCRERALKAFNLDPAKWGVNVQPYSGSTAKKKMTASSIYFQSFPYAIHPETHLIDYPALASQAKIFKPRLIICGASAYPRDWEYNKLREIADKEGAFLMCDMAHTSGIIAGQELASPFDHCDVVTTTTHKTLRGPRAGLIFFRKDLQAENAKDLEKRVNEAVFPACQGGPHNQTIAAVATALLQVSDPAFKAYAKQVVANARALADTLVGHGYKLQTGGTDNHLVLWDLRPIGLTGSKVEKICDLMGITINKNAVSGDASAQVPGGIRLGTSALTSRNMTEKDVKVVADFLHRTIQLSLSLQKEAGSKLLKDFVRVASSNAQVKELRDEVRAFAKQWPLPGVDAANFKKPEGIHDD